LKERKGDREEEREKKDRKNERRLLDRYYREIAKD